MRLTTRLRAGTVLTFKSSRWLTALPSPTWIPDVTNRTGLSTIEA